MPISWPWTNSANALVILPKPLQKAETTEKPRRLQSPSTSWMNFSNPLRWLKEPEQRRAFQRLVAQNLAEGLDLPQQKPQEPLSEREETPQQDSDQIALQDLNMLQIFEPPQQTPDEIWITRSGKESPHFS